jgi:hypothetical protein
VGGKGERELKELYNGGSSALENVFSLYRMRSLYIECVSVYRMCSLYVECVLYRSAGS